MYVMCMWYTRSVLRRFILHPSHVLVGISSEISFLSNSTIDEGPYSNVKTLFRSFSSIAYNKEIIICREIFICAE